MCLQKVCLLSTSCDCALVKLAFDSKVFSQGIIDSLLIGLVSSIYLHLPRQTVASSVYKGRRKSWAKTMYFEVRVGN